MQYEKHFVRNCLIHGICLMPFHEWSQQHIRLSSNMENTTAKHVTINNAADISVIISYFLVVIAVGIWVGENLFLCDLLLIDMNGQIMKMCLSIFLILVYI